MTECCSGAFRPPTVPHGSTRSPKHTTQLVPRLVPLKEKPKTASRATSKPCQEKEHEVITLAWAPGLSQQFQERSFGYTFPTNTTEQCCLSRPAMSVPFGLGDRAVQRGPGSSAVRIESPWHRSLDVPHPMALKNGWYW